MLLKKKKIIIGSCAFLFLMMTALAIFFISSSYSLLDNHVRVKENSELTYYIDVIYDGKDKNATTSDDNTLAEIRSDYIYVEDTIPEGLTFVNFVESEDGTIGAVSRGDTSKSCGGYVVDGVEGLHYNEETRTVTFTVKNLQAGCKLTVGIVTRTPYLGEKTRMDFYNTAFGRENTFSTSSNTVHVFMGKESAALHTVTYQYEEPVPDDAPALPEVASYAPGTTVGIIKNISVSGYEFSGWTSSDVTLAEGATSFVMPDKDVTIKAKFTKKNSYAVNYTIEGNGPSGYVPPKEKQYYENDTVIVDSLKVGDIVDGYRFLGWTTMDAVIKNDSGTGSEAGSSYFEMGTTPVTLTGKFELVKYTVTYQFQGTEIPPNADSLLPEVQSYAPGEIVTTASNPVADGYSFLGWYKPSTFEMPEEDVVILGEWMVVAGKFSPTISKTIVSDNLFGANSVNMVALGDNLAIGMLADGTSNGGYNQLFKDYLSSKNYLNTYQSYTQASYTLADWLTYLDDATVKSSIANSNLITLSFGMNAVNALNISAAQASLDTAAITAAIDQDSDDTKQVIAKIRSINKNAKILVVSHYNLALGNSATNKNVDKFDVLYSHWNDNYHNICSEYSCNVVDTYTSFKKNKETYLTSTSIYPTSLGYQSITDQMTRTFDVIGGAKEYYSNGEVVKFQITVTNTADFPINDVMLQEENSDSRFVSGTDYTLLNNSYVRIDSIPAHSSVTVNAEYTAGAQTFLRVNNTVSLTGALADGNYYLDTDQEYKSSTSFNVANVSLNIIKKDQDGNSLDGADFGLFLDPECTIFVDGGLNFEKLIPGKTYYLKETKTPTGYVLLKDVLPVVVDNSGNLTVENYDITTLDGKNSITIYNRKINILPNTGGIGTVPFVIVGLLLIVASAGGYVYFVKKRDGGRDHEKKNNK